MGIIIGNSSVIISNAAVTIGKPKTAVLGPLLDLLGSPRPLFAYSIRRITGSYDGHSIRVRRSSDNMQSDIGFVDNSLDVNSLLSFVGNSNGYVSIFYDQSGNGNHAVQSELTRQPLIVSQSSLITSSNGLPAVKLGKRHDNVTDSLYAGIHDLMDTGSSVVSYASFELDYYIDNFAWIISQWYLSGSSGTILGNQFTVGKEGGTTNKTSYLDSIPNERRILFSNVNFASESITPSMMYFERYGDYTRMSKYETQKITSQILPNLNINQPSASVTIGNLYNEHNFPTADLNLQELVFWKDAPTLINSAQTVFNSAKTYYTQPNGSTPILTPDPPIINSVLPGNNTLTVLWQNGNLNGANIIGLEWFDTVNGYWRTLRTVTGGIFYSNTISQTTSSIYNLTNGIEYPVTIRVFTDQGIYSSPSNTVNGIPNIAPPSAPLINSISSGNEELIINFTLGNSNGSTITDLEWYSTNTEMWQSLGGITSPISISGLTNDVEYDISIRAVTDNLLYSDPSNTVNATPSTIPDTPTINYISHSVFYGTVTTEIGFTLGNNNGLNIIDVQWYNDQTLSWQSLNTTNTPGYIYSGLTIGQEYNISIRSVTDINTYSNASTAVSTTPSEPIPDAPTINSITYDYTTGYATIDFTLGNDNGAILNGVEWYSDTFPFWQPLGSTLSPAYIVLSIGQEYNISIRSVTQYNSFSSASNTVSITPSGLPGSPGLQIDYTTCDGIYFTIFNFFNENGSPITDLEYSLDNGSTFTSLNSVEYTSYSVTGLPYGTTYDVGVRQINANGPSEISTVHTVTTAGTPGAPTIDYIAPGDSELSVYFTSPSDNCGVVAIDYSLDGGSNFIAAYQTSSPVIITELTNDVTYDVAIRLLSNEGAGDTSNVVQGTPTV